MGGIADVDRIPTHVAVGRLVGTAEKRSPTSDKQADPATD